MAASGGCRGVPRHLAAGEAERALLPSRQTGEQIVGVGALEEQVAGFGEAVGVLESDEELGHSFRGGRAELAGGQTNENRSFAGDALGPALLQPLGDALLQPLGDALLQPLGPARPKPGFAGLPAVTAELWVVVGGGALPARRAAGPPASDRPMSASRGGSRSGRRGFAGPSRWRARGSRPPSGSDPSRAGRWSGPAAPRGGGSATTRRACPPTPRGNPTLRTPAACCAGCRWCGPPREARPAAGPPPARRRGRAAARRSGPGRRSGRPPAPAAARRPRPAPSGRRPRPAGSATRAPGTCGSAARSAGSGRSRGRGRRRAAPRPSPSRATSTRCASRRPTRRPRSAARRGRSRESPGPRSACSAARRALSAEAWKAPSSVSSITQPVGRLRRRRHARRPG